MTFFIVQWWFNDGMVNEILMIFRNMSSEYQYKYFYVCREDKYKHPYSQITFDKTKRKKRKMFQRIQREFYSDALSFL